MAHPPNYENEYVDIGLKAPVHQELRKFAREEYGTESIPWSTVVSDLIEHYRRNKLPELKSE